LLIGYIVREETQHRKELREQQKQTTVFLRREVCARLQYRDEIFGTVLQAAATKYAGSDPTFANVLLSAMEALEFSTNRCLTQLPE
jgi:uracil phosphoribosyltransferase